MLYSHLPIRWFSAFPGFEHTIRKYPGERDRLRNGDQPCQERCLSKITRKLHTITTPTVDTLNLPREYADLIEVFSKRKASQLPLTAQLIAQSTSCLALLKSNQITFIVTSPQHKCLVSEILEWNSTPPKGRIFPLSQPESESMKTYIQEELARGSSDRPPLLHQRGFSFVKKKDGGLRPCIDYRGLNDNTVKFATHCHSFLRPSNSCGGQSITPSSTCVTPTTWSASVRGMSGNSLLYT